ncbi:M48 family metallopeptidase [Marinomonas foliarum]|uniref:M48 family metallopeptidase n=1 Tax=Marinomonas foliarum TaxID=491950 RepID=A0ABX7ISK0_9GAMM|nr:M48 family metallopeptidase [Marinomonas foliarum]QRV24966.1 M48 family metallopeptidase [Marinomonas foliarum]
MIEGRLYQAGASNFVPARLLISGNDFQLYAEGHSVIGGSCVELHTSHRLGNIARKITLQDGSVFETKDNNAIDKLLKPKSHASRVMAFVDTLEKNLSLVILSTFIIAGAVFISFKWGLPAVSHAIAEALPNSVNQSLSSHALQFLDKSILEPSKLPKLKQQDIRQSFDRNIAPLYQSSDTPKFTLHFRHWPSDTKNSIANALALPDGNIIVTDRLVELAQNSNEINIVLLHEMGHIVERHTLKRVIEGGIITVTSVLIFGDMSSISDLGVGVGSLLISNAYSREYESKADLFAYQLALKAKIPPSSLGDILTRMENDTHDDVNQTNKNTATKKVLGILSTHPNREQRTIMGKHYQACFDKSITQCPLVQN